MQNDNERLTYSVAEAAAILGVSKQLLYELARRGELPFAIRLGKRRIIISRVQLSRFLEVK